MVKHYLEGGSEEDCYLAADATTANTGGAGSLNVGFVPISKTTYERRALIRSDLLDGGLIPADATITSAKLWGNVNAVTGTPAADPPFHLSLALRDWVESEATWLIWSTGNNWTTAGCKSDGNDYDSTVQDNFAGPGALGWFSMDATNVIQDALNNQGGQIDVVLWRSTGIIDSGFTFASTEGSDPWVWEIEWTLANKDEAQVLQCG